MQKHPGGSNVRLSPAREITVVVARSVGRWRMYHLSWVVTTLILRSYQSQSFFFNSTKINSNITGGSLRSGNTYSEGSTNACPGVEGCFNCVQVDTRSICLQCLSPLWLWNGRCTHQCPVGMWVTNGHHAQYFVCLLRFRFFSFHKLDCEKNNDTQIRSCHANQYSCRL